MFLRGALYRDTATPVRVFTKTVAMPSTMPPVAAGVAWKCNNDMANDKNGQYFSFVITITEEDRSYPFVFQEHYYPEYFRRAENNLPF